jgi:hypothetical protein
MLDAEISKLALPQNSRYQVAPMFERTAVVAAPQ